MKKAPVKAEDNRTSVDLLIEQRRHQAQLRQFRQRKRRLFRWGILTALAVMAAGYYFSGASRISTIRVSGNVNMSRDQILKLSGLTEDSRWLLVWPMSVERRLRTYPFVSKVTVSHRAHSEILIHIEEKEPIGYRYISEPEILFKDGSTAPLDESVLGLIARIPLITGFESEEQTADLAMAFRDVSADQISLISEIRQFEVSYDPNMIRLMMHDGNQFFSSYYSMDVLNQYNSIVSKLNQQKACIYVDEMSKSAYTQRCPGEEAPVEPEPENGDNADENSDTNPSNQE